MQIRSPRRAENDPANEAVSNLFIAGIECNLNAFADAFPVEFYLTLPVLGKEGLAVFKALGIRELKSTWQNSFCSGHSLYISDKDFTPEGVRRIIQTLRDFAEKEGIPVEQPEEVSVPARPAPQSQSQPLRHAANTRSTLLTVLRDILPADIANAVAREISDSARRQLNGETHQFKVKREGLATLVVEKFSGGRGFRAIPTNPLATKFNIVDDAGNYAGYLIKITPLPPFEVEVFQVKQVGGRWASKEVFRQSFNPKS